MATSRQTIDFLKEKQPVSISNTMKFYYKTQKNTMKNKNLKKQPVLCHIKLHKKSTKQQVHQTWIQMSVISF